MARDELPAALERALAAMPFSQVVAVAPHPDDAALSVGGLLRLLRARWPVTVVTVFTRSVWAPNLPARRRLPEIVSPMRGEEDRRYCRALGASYRELGLEDAGLRGYGHISEREEIEPGDDARARVRPLLERALRERERPLVLSPAGIGGHVDHVVVRDALLELRPRPAMLLYEDLVYAAEQPRAASAPPAFMGPTEFVVPISLEAKLAGLDPYRSQIRLSDREAVRTTAERAGTEPSERVWMVSPEECGRARS